MSDDQDGCEWMFLLVPAYPGSPGQKAGDGGHVVWAFVVSVCLSLCLPVNIRVSWHEVHSRLSACTVREVSRSNVWNDCTSVILLVVVACACSCVSVSCWAATVRWTSTLAAMSSSTISAPSIRRCLLPTASLSYSSTSCRLSAAMSTFSAVRRSCWLFD